MSYGRLALLLTLALAGCNPVAPYATGPLAAKAGVKDEGPRVAICFNPLKTADEKLQELGQAECLGDTVAKRVDTDYRLYTCSVMVPGRATFVCEPKKK
ncbi:MAG TPA: hypothetical protein VG308_21005 [Stellaceae bacterium]|jgi:hypothetical protein|nr:hypothetical protein [Stellaceae bacterium]